MNWVYLCALTSFGFNNFTLTINDINCMVSNKNLLIYEYLPSEEEINRVSEELEEITLRHPELVWEPIEV